MKLGKEKLTINIRFLEVPSLKQEQINSNQTSEFIAK